MVLTFKVAAVLELFNFSMEISIFVSMRLYIFEDHERNAYRDFSVYLREITDTRFVELANFIAFHRC